MKKLQDAKTKLKISKCMNTITKHMKQEEYPMNLNLYMKERGDKRIEQNILVWQDPSRKVLFFSEAYTETDQNLRITPVMLETELYKHDWKPIRC